MATGNERPMEAEQGHESPVQARSAGIAVPFVDLHTPLPDQLRAAVAAGADFIELRIDLIGDARAAAQLLAAHPDQPFIVTIRRAAEGGAWTGDEAQRLALLRQLRPRRGYVDVELAAWEPWRRATADEPVPSTTQDCIVSHHDCARPPPGLDGLFAALRATGAAAVKAAFTPRDATDALRILAALRRSARERPTIALGMGAAGLATRVLARKFGALLTFATLTPQTASAPGQPTIAELRSLYRWEAITPATAVYGVVGWPIQHSRSPHAHNAAFEAGGNDAVYLPLPVAPLQADFDAFMDYLAGNAWLDVRGLSITLPHKEHALRWLLARGHDVSDAAQRSGSVNTLTRTPAGWRGDDTDGAGALAALLTDADLARRGLGSVRVAVLGAGGAARAAAAALIDAGARVTIFNRDAARAAALAARLGCAAAAWEARAGCDAEVLVNCTPVGMHPQIDETPIDLAAGPAFAVVLDTVYNPRETRLLREARRSGRRAISGVEMFIHQAAAQQRLWLNREIDAAVLHRALAAAESGADGSASAAMRDAHGAR
jgi:3-dehydroquinate dehydratase/shikimate dehydrogenase